MIKKYNQIFVSFSTVAGDILMLLLGARTAGYLLSFAAKKKKKGIGLFIPAFTSHFPPQPDAHLSPGWTDPYYYRK